MDEIHDRMPVVLELDDVETWINGESTSPRSDCNCSYRTKRTLVHHGVSSAVDR